MRLSRSAMWGLLALVLGAWLWSLVQTYWLSPWLEQRERAQGDSPEQARAMAAFEAQRLADSAAAARKAEAEWAAQQAEWEAEKAARRARKAEREARYAAQQQQWAAEKADRRAQQAQREAHWDSLRALRPEKLKLGSRLDLNTADTLSLQRVPGVGRGLARAIVSYRERLGGFVSLSQLAEIEALPHDVQRWFRLSPAAPQLLSLNQASFKALLRHPYLTYEQVRAIVQRRERVGRLRSWDDLRSSPHFHERDFERLAPYFGF